MAAEEVKVSEKKVSLKECNWSDEETEQLTTSYEARTEMCLGHLVFELQEQGRPIKKWKTGT